MSAGWLEGALNDQEGRELVEAIHERKAAAGGHRVESEPEGTYCRCGFAPDDAMDRFTQYQEVVEHVRASIPTTEEPNE